MSSTTTTTTPATEPLLLSVDQVCELLGKIHKTHLYALHNAGRLPLPIRLGRRTLWRADELKKWTMAGCPDRKRWLIMQGSRNNDYKK